MMKSKTEAAPWPGIPCAVCGLAGLRIREITVAMDDGPARRMLRTQALSCCFCHSAVAVGGILAEELTCTP